MSSSMASSTPKSSPALHGAGSPQTTTCVQNTTHRRVRNCCRRLFAFLFSQVGLAAMVIAYSILGGFLFQAIEAPAEASVVRRLAEDRRLQVENIVDKFFAELNSPPTTARPPPLRGGGGGGGGGAGVGGGVGGAGGKQHSLNGSFSARFVNRTRLIENIDASLVLYQRLVATAIKDEGWDGRDEKDQSMVKWSFAGALLFAVTVTTTIGYGHVVPKTPWGRFLTMVYALVGIPLTFLYLSTIGDFLAKCFRIFYRRVCCDVCCCRRCELARRQRHIERQILKNSTVVMAKLPIEVSTTSVTPATGGRVAPLYPWRSKVDAGGLGPSTALLSRAGSLPDCVGSSTTMRDRSRGRSPGRLGLPAAAKLNMTKGRDYSEPAYGIVRHSSMKMKGVATTPGRTRRVCRPFSEGAAMSTANDSAAPSGTSPKTVTKFAWLKKCRGVNKTTDSDSHKRAIGIRSTSFDDEWRLEIPATGSRTDLSRPSEADARVRRRPVTSNLEAPARSRISRRNSDVQIVIDVENSSREDCTGEYTNVRRLKSRGDTLRRSFSDRRSDKRTVNSTERRPRTNYGPTSFPGGRRKAEAASYSNDDATPTSAKLSKSADRTTVKATIADSPRTVTSYRAVVSYVDVRPHQTASNDSQIVAELTGSDNMSIASIGTGSLESFVTAPDEFSIAINYADSDVDDENTTTSGRSNFKSKEHTYLSPLNLPVSPQSSTVKSSSSKPQQITSGLSTSGATGNTAEFAKSRPAHIRIRFDSPRSQAQSVDYATTESVDQRGVTSGGEGDLTSIGHHKVACEKVRVPIYICLIVIISYVLGGSVLFMLWEGWGVLDASYFCFVTLSTIGFGDVVPGTATGSWDEASTEKLVLCILWLAFGLSLLAMCFNLMQEEVKEKCKTVAKKCGLIGSDDT